ncbi:GIY-YIG nuclease family protein [Desulfovibrio sp. ZJ200]|uniref:GIY-YIG nuclease family protein n=1 Tax=Desulfovibrio sp. ZJ200 TaxID=2709792 RepID=UPI001F14F517|nr:GIY-YIG nuclease family protein [Desulfovibrio sp. ZJ200]
MGYTLKDPALRAQELDSTGVPHPYLVEFEILVDEPFILEQNVHRYLKEYNENKEWFRCNFDECVISIHKCYRGKIYYEKTKKKERELEYNRRIAEEQKAQAEREQARSEQQAREARKQIEEKYKATLDKELNAYIQKQKRNWSFILTSAVVALALYMSNILEDVEAFLLVFIPGMIMVVSMPFLISNEEWKKDFLKKRERGNKL